MTIPNRATWVFLFAAMLLLAAASPSQAVTLNAGTSGTAYVPNLFGSGTGSVTVVDVASGSVLKQIPVSYPYGLTVSSSGDRVFATSFGGGTDDGDSVSVIDTTTREVTDVIDLGASMHAVDPNGVAHDAGRNQLYVALSAVDKVAIVDLSDGTVTQLSVGDNPIGVTYSPLSDRVYVTNYGADTVSVINPNTGLVVGDPIAVGDAPVGIVSDEENRRVLVADSGSGTVSAISEMSNAVVKTITLPTGATPEGIALAGGRVAVSNVGVGGITLINASSLKITSRLLVDGCWGIDITVDGRVVAGLPGSGGVSIVRASGPLRPVSVSTGVVPLGLGPFIVR